MLIQFLLTALAGLVLGVVIMRTIQSRGDDGRPTTADVAVDPSGPEEPSAAKSGPRLTQTRMILGVSGGLALLAVAIVFFRPASGPDNAPILPAMSPTGGAETAKLDDVDTMISRLEARLKQNPNDGEGFRMLGWSFQNTGKSAEAVLAYANAVKLLPKRADVQAGYGEALVSVAGDKVTAEAKSHIDEALRLDPKEPRARFIASLYKAQNGNERAALDEWIALSNSSAPDLPWQADIRQRIGKLAAKLGVDVSTRLTPVANPAAVAGGPSPEQMAAARTLPVDQQQSMIDGMVNGLAVKLQRNPDDIDGWLKLIRSRVVLKDAGRARDDLAMARKTFAKQPAKLSQVNALANELGL